MCLLPFIIRSDINECETGEHDCDLTTEVCINEEPGFDCECKEGFEKDGKKGCVGKEMYQQEAQGLGVLLDKMEEWKTMTTQTG